MDQKPIIINNTFPIIAHSQIAQKITNIYKTFTYELHELELRLLNHSFDLEN